MTLQAVESFARELAALVQTADRAQAKVDEINGLLEGAASLSDLQMAAQLRKQREEVGTQRDQMIHAALDKARRPSFESVHELLVDLEVRVNMARREHASWRQMVADFEFRVEAGGVEGNARADMETELGRIKAGVDLRTRMAEQLLPVRPIVLLP